MEYAKHLIPPNAETFAGVGVLMAVFWLTEAIPVVATALTRADAA